MQNKTVTLARRPRGEVGTERAREILGGVGGHWEGADRLVEAGGGGRVPDTETDEGGGPLSGRKKKKGLRGGIIRKMNCWQRKFERLGRLWLRIIPVTP